MSLMIKGNIMPKSCSECPCISYDEFERAYCCAVDVDNNDIYDEWNTKLPDCPLRILPAKHGRLIDADVLINDLQGLRKLFPSTGMDYIGGVISLVQNTPAIIEAEGL